MSYKLIPPTRTKDMTWSHLGCPRPFHRRRQVLVPHRRRPASLLLPFQMHRTSPLVRRMGQFLHQLIRPQRLKSFFAKVTVFGFGPSIWSCTTRPL
ncbi:unnamed protein product [Linum trigynum]|uniref:Uncharacterized protein n=1 Tax=Linum trigynum TaxID=586398 RepID=A0AAV2EN09_9ROSI